MYTKGEWQIDEGTFLENGDIGISNQMRRICTVNNACGLLPKEEQQANACLIAAAPNLLVVLENIANQCWDAMEGAGLPEFQYYGHWHKMAKDAITKAKGRF